MDIYPKMLYKKGGDLRIDKHFFEVSIVKDEQEEKASLKAGWSIGPLEALAYKPRAAAKAKKAKEEAEALATKEEAEALAAKEEAEIAIAKADKEVKEAEEAKKLAEKVAKKAEKSGK